MIDVYSDSLCFSPFPKCLNNTCSTSFNIESEYSTIFAFLCEPKVQIFEIKYPPSDAYLKPQTLWAHYQILLSIN